jgi:methionine aminopeptidase
MEHVEAPFRTVGDEHSGILIEENMVLSIEDFRVSSRGEYLHSEHTLAVTADGVEILSKYPEKLYEFPV